MMSMKKITASLLALVALVLLQPSQACDVRIRIKDDHLNEDEDGNIDVKSYNGGDSACWVKKDDARLSIDNWATVSCRDKNSYCKIDIDGWGSQHLCNGVHSVSQCTSKVEFRGYCNKYYVWNPRMGTIALSDGSNDLVGDETGCFNRRELSFLEEGEEDNAGFALRGSA